ncbi:MAG: GNAT family N-acetyltransferase [Caldimonas sp.]
MFGGALNESRFGMILGHGASKVIMALEAVADPNDRIERYEASDGHVYRVEYLDHRFVARKFAGSVYVAGALPRAGVAELSEEQASRAYAVCKIEEKISARAASSAWHETLRDGTPTVVRPIREDDVKLERAFIEGLSPASRRFRFLDSMTSPGGALLKQLTVIDPAVDPAFVAVIVQEGHETEIGVGRFSAQADNMDCEFAIVVSDAWQGKGLGTILMERLIDAARARRIPTMHAISASNNVAMRKLADGMCMLHTPDPDNTAQVIYRAAL